ISIRMSSSGPTYMVEDDDTYSVSQEPSRSDKSPPRSDESLTNKGDFDVCQICKKKNIDIRYTHNSSTGNMLGHLWSKHQIDKDHPEGTTTDGLIIKAMHIINKRRQEKIAQLLVEFIIEDCQLIHILRNQAFRRLLNYIEAGFRIPCEPTVKKMIDKAYDWSCDQLFELRKVIDYLVLMLPSEPERCDRLDGEYLKLITLTKNEWQLLDSLIRLLKPFYNATKIFSGSSYPTLNLIYPTMKLLIKDQSQSINNENSDELDIKNEFDTLVALEQLRQLLQVLQGWPPVITEELYDLVKAASYLSFQEYWEVPEEIGLVSSFLDPRIKHLKFLVGLDKSPSVSTFETATNNDLIVALYSSEEPDDEIFNEGEVDRYLREPIEKMCCNPLVW
ncbi:39342_t:CDS:2, partial [Gigaspora margarita]